MHIEPTTHEHGPTARVYTYEGDFDVGDDAITWNATVSQGQQTPRVIAGTIPVTSPAVAALADKVVRDAIVQTIDAGGAARGEPAQARPAVPSGQLLRSPLHDALEMFVGQWRAEGLAHGSAQPSNADPDAGARTWKGTHSAHWHTGRFFLLFDEKAHAGTAPLDTVGVMGVDAHTGRLFACCLDNHGRKRRYHVHVDGRRWSFDGQTERARVDFSADGRTQRIVWERNAHGRWLPLSERTAVRVD